MTHARRPLLALAALALTILLARDAHAHGLLVAAPVDGQPVPSPEDGPPVRLLEHRVTATVDGPVAQVQVEQVFHNATDQRLEGTWLFPLPEGASVSSFAMTFAGAMVQGEVLPADEARRVYESIVRRRRDPGLLEYVGRGLYRARVFPIEPTSDVTIRLAFQQVLPEDAGALEIRYPLATDRLHGEPVARTSVRLHVREPEGVDAVWSPTHEIEVERQGPGEVLVRLDREGERQRRDLVVYAGRHRQPGEVGVTLLTHHEAGEDGTFLAVFTPRARAREHPLPRDVLFVVDTSGSMGSEGKIGQAVRSVGLGLQSLRRGDRFGIVTFASLGRPFRDRLLEATPETTTEACRWLEAVGVGGGTNLEGGLVEALRLQEPERLTLLVLVSDGRPSVGARTADALLAALHTEAPSLPRIFTFGVGTDLDVELLDRLAESSGGARDYVLPGDELEQTTSRFFAKVDEPRLVDVEVALGSGVYDVYPPRLPDLFAGDQLVVMGRYETPGARRIELRGRAADEVVAEGHDVVLGAGPGVEALPRLWAHRKVAFLLDEMRLHGETPELVEEVVRLATRYAIVTPYTAALVAPELELQAAAGPPVGPPPPPTTPSAPGRDAGGPRSGSRARYRGPSGQVPPGLREPADPSPPPPPPPSGPPASPSPTTPSPSGGAPVPVTSPTARSKALAREQARSSETERGGVRSVGARTFGQRPDGAWVETGLDEAATPRRVVFLSEGWSALAAGDPDVARVLALGEHVLFRLGDEVLEVVPAAE